MPELEDNAYWPRNFQRNQAFLAPGQHAYNTQLNPQQEMQFRQWLAQNNVPFDPNQKVSDYDMRGFWAALQSGNPVARQAIDPNDQKMHYPDYWKTPYSATFSNESQWANPKTAPRWNGDQYALPSGQVLWDDKAQKWVGPDAPWSPDLNALRLRAQQNQQMMQKMQTVPAGAGQLGSVP
jgi:hypothetical protein